MMELAARMGTEERQADLSLGLEAGEEDYELFWPYYTEGCVHQDSFHPWQKPNLSFLGLKRESY